MANDSRQNAFMIESRLSQVRAKFPAIRRTEPKGKEPQKGSEAMQYRKRQEADQFKKCVHRK